MITIEDVLSFKNYLIENEKTVLTIEKYIHDVRTFLNWLGEKELTKSEVISYKVYLSEIYAPASVNAVISSLNSFFIFLGRYDLKVKSLKIQRNIFALSEKELTKGEYEKLLFEAKSKHNIRLYLLMQTICSSGIRVSELKYITVESVRRECAEINCKGKFRRILLPGKLCKMLKQYIRDKKISRGPIFITKNGKPLDRSNIWSDMKKLCKSAGVSDKKVFPHNLRHLFAKTYYSIQKDIVRLADILGHSSINTTRIYTMESGEVHRRQIQCLGLLLC